MCINLISILPAQRTLTPGPLARALFAAACRWTEMGLDSCYLSLYL